MNANGWLTEVVPIEILKSEACFVIWLLFYRVDIGESFVACGRNVNEKQLSKDPKVHLTSSRQSLYSALLILLVHRKLLFTLRSETIIRMLVGARFLESSQDEFAHWGQLARNSEPVLALSKTTK